ncbi:MAG: AAA family ATPase [Candidatus Aenigmarchaeota archaeon]|nr:AAA family ATPase [Candidatus Aenigmarchaeota archaeon]
MNSSEWTRRFEHPYAQITKAASTHGHLKPTLVKVPPFSTFAVPFAWTLRREQDAIDAAEPKPLPPDDEPPFPTAWVFGRARQEAILKLFFGKLVPDRSLVFFYSKEGHPLGDTISRLVVGVGRIDGIVPAKAYEVDGEKPAYLLWDRLFRHSIRPEGEEGFLFPYHDYLEPTGDPKEDKRRQELVKEIAVAADPAHIRVFSYAAELAPPDIVLSTLVRCLKAVRRIRAHGIAKGPWERREEWLNAQIAATWKDRGAFPGLGSVLEALGMRLGTALALELISSRTIRSDEDPWPTVDAILRGNRKPPQPAYEADLKAMRTTWVNLPEERRSLMKLLSRFAMTPTQARRWFDPSRRNETTIVPVSDREILDNPYRLAESDLGELDDSPVSLGMIDRGLLPESTIAAKHPVPAPSRIESLNDPRRVRSAIVTVLRQAAENGDALLSSAETLKAVSRLDLAHPPVVGTDWLTANRARLRGVVEQVDIVTDVPAGRTTMALQLTDLKHREERLHSILEGRVKKTLPLIRADWRKHLVEAITEAGGRFEKDNSRHVRALGEQAEALERLTSRRLTALVGRAGTGKTSILGALMLCHELSKDGILLLAPTGKARVRLARATNAKAMTIAQFLYGLGRYDGERQRPLFTGRQKYRKEKTVVIDECSMLTMDDMFAVLEALDLAHVERLILVGDPNQLPPIGVGRPFADLAAFLEAVRSSAARSARNNNLADALSRLTVEVRTSATDQGDSDTLRLASWFTREAQPADADRVLSDLELGARLNDLEVMFWKTPEELHTRLMQAFKQHLGLQDARDISGFDEALGLDKRGWVPFDSPDGAERFQILSPVRMHSYGVHDLNRWVQQLFRARELKAARNRWTTSLGDEEIVVKDKVIQTRNERRKAYDGSASDDYYLANGEVGLMATGTRGWLNVVFAGRPGFRFGYCGRNFPSGTGPLELAYALTVHKAQGSEFRKVFVILPKTCRLLSRELLYTALTRSRDQLVLLIEGNDATMLFDLTRPEKSETAKRNTNLFQGVVREDELEFPHAEHLIHRTEKGHLVRSKSELVIANMLFRMGIEYEYERVCEGTVEDGRLRPDFSFITPAGDLIIWEHLGMLDCEDYRRGWEWKKNWYERNGFVLGETLFVTQEDERGGLDSRVLGKIASEIKQHLT